jgi:hypothetical protein
LRLALDAIKEATSVFLEKIRYASFATLAQVDVYMDVPGGIVDPRAVGPMVEHVGE